jgi:hypothetical protein
VAVLGVDHGAIAWSTRIAVVAGLALVAVL